MSCFNCHEIKIVTISPYRDLKINLPIPFQENFSEPENIMNSTRIKKALHHEAAPGVLLMLAMVAALIVANSGVTWYGGLLETKAIVGIGTWTIAKPLLLWINDGLMAVFFLLVGLELKREVLFGELSDRRSEVRGCLVDQW